MTAPCSIPPHPAITDAIARQVTLAEVDRLLISRLLAENERLRAALEQIATYEAQQDISAPVRRAHKVRIAKAAIDWEQGPREKGIRHE